MATKWKFKVEIRSTSFGNASEVPKSLVKLVNQFHAVIKGKNGEIVFTGEPRKRKSALIKTVNNLFPGVVIVDKTQSKK